MSSHGPKHHHPKTSHHVKAHRPHHASLRPRDGSDDLILPEKAINYVAHTFGKTAGSPELEKGMKELLRETPTQALNEASAQFAQAGQPFTPEVGKEVVRDLAQNKALAVGLAAMVADTKGPRGAKPKPPKP